MSPFEAEFTDQHKESIKRFFDEFQEAFPDINPFYVVPLLFMIDMKTWKFPETLHEGAIVPQIEFIEQNETLRHVFQGLKNDSNENR